MTSLQPSGTSTAERFPVMVHVDREVLADPDADADGRCDLADEGFCLCQGARGRR